MDVDLIISQSGDVMVASNQEFPAEVLRVEYHRENKLIMLVFENNEPDNDKLMDIEIHDSLVKNIEDITSIFVVHMKDNKPFNGFEVPFVKIGL